MSTSHSVIKEDSFWAVRDEREHRVLSPRFKTENQAHLFRDMIKSPDYGSMSRGFATISDIARELHISPFRARAALRRQGMKPETGRWKLLRGTPEYAYIRKLLQKIKKI